MPTDPSERYALELVVEDIRRASGSLYDKLVEALQAEVDAETAVFLGSDSDMLRMNQGRARHATDLLTRVKNARTRLEEATERRARADRPRKPGNP